MNLDTGTTTVTFIGDYFYFDDEEEEDDDVEYF